MWSKFLETNIGFSGCPIFYQFITKLILEKVLKYQFPVDSRAIFPNNDVEGNEQSTDLCLLDFKESNALRYCGGYLLRSIKKKIGKSAHPIKQKLLLCVQDLLEGIMNT